jgi:hypothetical protein
MRLHLKYESTCIISKQHNNTDGHIACSAEAPQSWETWHCQFGHISYCIKAYKNYSTGTWLKVSKSTRDLTNQIVMHASRPSNLSNHTLLMLPDTPSAVTKGIEIHTPNM